MGTGTYLIAIRDRLLKGLKNVIIDEEKRRQHILNNMIYGADINKSKVSIVQKLLGSDIHIINTDSLKYNWNMKFDVVVGNPPFLGKTYINFLNLAYKLSNRYVIFIHPSMIYLNQRPVIRRPNELFYYSISNKILDIKLFHSENYFKEIALMTPMAMTYMDKSKISNNIEIIDDVHKKTYTVNNIKNIHLFEGTGNIFSSLKNKILTIAQKDNMSKHSMSEGTYYVNVAKVRGHTTSNKDKWVSDDFYTFFQKNTYVSKQKQQTYFGFNDEKTANNFLNYLKTDFARFCLALYKTSMTQSGSELLSIPWLNFSQEWADKKLYKHFNLTDEEIKFIETNIPKYY